MGSAAVIGKLNAVLGLDAREFSSGMGQAKKDLGGFGLNAKTGFAVAGAAATVGFGLMTKGALEMESAQGKFQAATGRSREEAIQFSKDMNGIVGTALTVGRSFEEIAAAGIQVAQQFGLTGEEGAKLTEQFLGFAKVTGQDAAGAVDSFDAALDAFGEPAGRAVALMDQLIVSNQKYGTDAGPAAVKALQDMAPALTAMGEGLDYGVGALNLFETAGIDAGGAQIAFNKAIDDLPPGGSFDDIIAKLGAIEDPALRDAAAVEIFGEKAGHKMALAIKPGMTSLDDFKISMEDSAGASEKAATDMLTTADKFKMFAEKIGGFFRDAGQAFGPLLSGLAALGPLMGTQLGKAWDGVKDSPAVKKAVEKAGLFVGSLYAGAVKVVEALGNVLSAAWIKLGLPGSVTMTAAGGAGAGAGGAFLAGVGSVLSGASLAAIFLAPVAVVVDLYANDGKGADAVSDWVVRTFAPLEPVRQQVADFFKPVGDLGAQINLFLFGPPGSEREARKRGLEWVDAAAEGVASGRETLTNTVSGIGQEALDAIAAQAPAFEQAGQRDVAAVGAGFLQSKDQLAENARATLRFAGQVAEQQGLADARKLGAAVPGELGSEIYKNATQILPGIAEIRRLLKEGLTPEQIAAQAIGQEFLRDVGLGMISAIPGLKETSQETAIQSIKAIEAAGLEGKKGQQGLKAIGQYFDMLLRSGMTAPEALAALREAGVDMSDKSMDGIRSRFPQFFNTGAGAADEVSDGFMNHKWAADGGSNAQAWFDGFKTKFDRFNFANVINSNISPYWSGQSPPPKGPLHNIGKWAANTWGHYIDVAAKTLQSGSSRLNGALSFSPVTPPSFAMADPNTIPAGAAGRDGGSVTVNAYGQTFDDVERQIARFRRRQMLREQLAS